MTNQRMTQGERIAVLEMKMTRIEETAGSMDKKLDELLALRNKGAGAFWLASMLFGTSIVSAMLALFNYLKGV